MWHAEAIARSKVMPPMKDFLGVKTTTKIDEAAVKARLRAYQKKRDDDRNG